MGVYRIAYATNEGWANGLAPSKYVGAAATYDPATAGIDPFRSLGELRSGYQLISFGGVTVTDTIKRMQGAMVYNGTTLTRAVFGYGDGGKLYQINAVTDSPSLIDTAASPTDGLEVHKDYVYYSRQTAVSRYGAINAGSPSATASYLTGLTATSKGSNLPHPLHSWAGYLYVGDGNILKRVIGTESAGTTGSTAITLDSDLVITDITDNGSYLVLACNTEVNPSGSGVKTHSYVVFWNGTDAAASLILALDEPMIYGVRTWREDTFVFAYDNAYIVNNMRANGKNFTLFNALEARVGAGGIAENNGQLFWKQNNCIKAYGTPDTRLPSVFSKPITASGTTIGAIFWPMSTKIYVADNNALYKGTSTTSETSTTFLSKVISESQQFMVTEVRIYLADELAANDELDILVYDETGTPYTAITLDYATYGAVNQATFYAAQFGDAPPALSSMQIGIKFNGGAVRVREVVVKTQAITQH